MERNSPKIKNNAIALHQRLYNQMYVSILANSIMIFKNLM